MKIISVKKISEDANAEKLWKLREEIMKTSQALQDARQRLLTLENIYFDGHVRDVIMDENGRRRKIQDHAFMYADEAVIVVDKVEVE